MRLEDFDYELPPERIAQTPAERRDASRLLVHARTSGETRHTTFRELPECIPPGALIVVNDTRVLPARLRARKPTGGAVELLVLDPAAAQGGVLRCLARSSKPLRPGTRLDLLDRAGAATWWTAEVLEREGEGALVRIDGLGTGGVMEVLETLGEVPLPPYILREGAPDADDEERYQTVYAREPGAVAAPTAGLHFTAELLETLRARGHDIVTLTLHVGPGTFAPVRTDDVRSHPMHPEAYTIPDATAAAINRAKSEKRAVLAVGTTVVRALESAALEAHVPAIPAGQQTRLFIYPGWHFRVVDALLTNFHLPRSTLLMLVSALVGREKLLALYREAIDRGYRFYSYGDAMLINP
jgi:S-adenosylmethionine:tRNA ribosyltransferase-isomerase